MKTLMTSHISYFDVRLLNIEKKEKKLLSPDCTTTHLLILFSLLTFTFSLQHYPNIYCRR